MFIAFISDNVNIVKITGKNRSCNKNKQLHHNRLTFLRLIQISPSTFDATTAL